MQETPDSLIKEGRRVHSKLGQGPAMTAAINNIDLDQIAFDITTTLGLEKALDQYT